MTPIPGKVVIDKALHAVALAGEQKHVIEQSLKLDGLACTFVKDLGEGQVLVNFGYGDFCICPNRGERFLADEQEQ